MIASIPDGDEGEAEEETEGASHLSNNSKPPTLNNLCLLKNDKSSASATRKADNEDGYDDHDQDKLVSCLTR